MPRPSARERTRALASPPAGEASFFTSSAPSSDDALVDGLVQPAPAPAPNPPPEREPEAPETELPAETEPAPAPPLPASADRPAAEPQPEDRPRRSRNRPRGKTVRVGATMRRSTSEWYQRLGYSENTGNDFDIGGIFFHGVVLEAVRELAPDIDVRQIDRDNPADAVERVKEALLNLKQQ
jgi:hypothetical protein